MEKSKLQKQFEEESGLSWSNQTSIPEGHGYSYECGQWLEAMLTEAQAKAAAYDSLVSKTVMSDAELDAPTAQRILREMAEKAEAYDRIMSGGKKTLQEYIEKYWDKQVIDFAVRLDGEDSFYIHPALESGDTLNFKAHGNYLETIWEDALPDGWEG
jgi:histone H3/H4